MSEKKHYFVPNHLNKESYLHIWWMEDYKPSAFFIQVSEDEDNPIWMNFGEILELLCRKELDSDPDFIESIRNSLKYSEDKLGIAHIKNKMNPAR